MCFQRDLFQVLCDSAEESCTDEKNSGQRKNLERLRKTSPACSEERSYA